QGQLGEGAGLPRVHARQQALQVAGEVVVAAAREDQHAQMVLAARLDGVRVPVRALVVALWRVGLGGLRARRGRLRGRRGGGGRLGGRGLGVAQVVREARVVAAAGERREQQQRSQSSTHGAAV